ncbi:hypothetical protein GCU56_03900 [Geodermatophilus sabuli]|uniref:NmrA-like family protein n=1 Tax=Geodermatophilus sabuli TaxID=1564158 RepID=A0A7K3VWI8_9ACTN|nr:hypothetical protein [Geodermatophilus sabuli]NEK57015.1 hypothetical protein [Geodermatophilus sabuli]
MPEPLIAVVGATGRQGGATARALRARYEPLPLDVLGDDEDLRAMFAWFGELPAYQGDVAATRALAPDTHDLPAWLAASGWSPGAPSRTAASTAAPS